MALPAFCYLVTAFGFTVWTHAPFVTFSIICMVQAIMFIAGIDVPSLNDYVFWDILIAACGGIVGFALLVVTRVPRFLKFEASYVGTWGQFAIWAVAYLAAQLFLGFFPPPAYPWGIIGTAAAHLVIQILLWVVMYQNVVIFASYQSRKYFFALWLFTLFLMEMLFFIAMSSLDQVYVSLIAAGGGLVLVIAVRFLLPLKTPYSASSGVAGEPLIGPAPPTLKLDEENM